MSGNVVLVSSSWQIECHDPNYMSYVYSEPIQDKNCSLYDQELVMCIVILVTYGISLSLRV